MGRLLIDSLELAISSKWLHIEEIRFINNTIVVEYASNYSVPATLTKSFCSQIIKCKYSSKYKGCIRPAGLDVMNKCIGPGNITTCYYDESLYLCRYLTKLKYGKFT